MGLRPHDIPQGAQGKHAAIRQDLEGVAFTTLGYHIRRQSFLADPTNA